MHLPIRQSKEDPGSRPAAWRWRLVLVVLASLATVVVMDVVVRWRVVGSDNVYKGHPMLPWGEVHGMTEKRLRTYLDALERAPSTNIHRAFDAELGWTNLPGEQAPFHFNSVGARGPREYASVPADGTLRVVAYGESFTFGSEVERDEVWCAQVEQLDEAIEVVNLGVAAFGTDQALLRFRRKGLVGAKVVIVGLMLENICRNVNRFRSLYEPLETTPAVKPRFVLEEGGSLALLPVPFQAEADFIAAVLDGSILERTSEGEYWAGDRAWISGSALCQVVGIRRAIARRDARRHWLESSGEPYRVTLSILECFRDEALAAGAERVLVLLFGSRQDMRRLEESGAPYWTELLNDLDGLGIPSIDIATLLLPRWREEGMYQGHHLGPIGNHLVAERVVRWLRE